MAAAKHVLAACLLLALTVAALAQEQPVARRARARGARRSRRTPGGRRSGDEAGQAAEGGDVDSTEWDAAKEGAGSVFEPQGAASTSFIAPQYIISYGREKEPFRALDYRYVFENMYKARGFEVCSPDSSVTQRGWMYTHRKIDCKALFQKVIDDASLPKVAWPPPRTIPQELARGYLMEGYVPHAEWYFADKRHSDCGQQNAPREWTKSLFTEFQMKAADEKEFQFKHETFRLYEALSDFKVAGHRGVVIDNPDGPWLEATAVAKGAAEVVSIDDWPINTAVANHSWLAPVEAAKAWLADQLPAFDFAITFNSFVHSGLGRYGDRLDPDADLADMARASCLVRPGGTMFLGLMTGPDEVVWNAHRIYGPLRLPLLMANWEFLAIYGGNGERMDDFAPWWHAKRGRMDQAVMVMRNRRTAPCVRGDR